jgi:non-ribosomal peptide synthetase component E (peptide arylation enzyme)
MAELRGFLRSRLADHELPSRVVVVDRIPRNDAGKVRKRDLVTYLTDEHGERPERPGDGG